MAVDASRAVVMDIPVRVVGNSPGVRAGGKLVKKINRLRVRGFVKNLPDYIDVNIDTLEIGQSVKVKNVTPGNFEILDAKENAIVSCKTTRALMQAAAETGK
jgi:large subunit ribosomal protein L25